MTKKQAKSIAAFTNLNLASMRETLTTLSDDSLVYEYCNNALNMAINNFNSTLEAALTNEMNTIIEDIAIYDNKKDCDIFCVNDKLVAITYKNNSFSFNFEVYQNDFNEFIVY